MPFPMSQSPLDQMIEAAVAHHRAGNLHLAEPIYRQVLAADPNHPDALNLLGVLARQTGHAEASRDLIQRAINLRPDNVMYRCNLAEVLTSLGQLDDAITLLRPIVATHPNFFQAWINLATALSGKGFYAEATTASEKALSLQPDEPINRKNLALLLLLQGNFERGWREHEARWKIHDPSVYRQNFTQPQWRGEDLNGRRILLHPEQGYGDSIQFVRYAPLVKARGGHVILQCFPELERLFKTLEGVDEFIVANRPLPPFDIHCPLLSLPLVMGTTLQNIPSQMPYLHAKPADVERFRKRLSSESKRKIGLCWAGSRIHINDHNRSMPFSALKPLLAMKDRTRFISLQVGTPTDDPDLLDWTSELQDFANTAGLIANLDLVITVDTSIAHLAGAMGKPVWTVLPFAPDWRWLLDRNDSPWYPTMRLFRQPIAGDWQTPIAQAIENLERFR